MIMIALNICAHHQERKCMNYWLLFTPLAKAVNLADLISAIVTDNQAPFSRIFDLSVGENKKIVTKYDVQNLDGDITEIQSRFQIIFSCMLSW